MERKRIENMETWIALKRLIVEKGYFLWQTQYDWFESEGFIAGFMKEHKRLEVITHNKAIEDDIVRSGL